MDTDGSHVLLGIVCSAHGVRGQVRVKTFTHDPRDIAAYGAVTDGERTYEIKVVSVLKNGMVIAHVGGVETRDAADALKDVRFFVHPSCLPKLENGEFYHVDLIGLAVKLLDGTEYGSITDVLNFGTCDIVEIAVPSGKKVLFPFTECIFPDVFPEKGEILFVPPETVGA
ncbi:ribosome maturation factor RimM [Candidatus Anaplasma sp. TIGMIC]|nr:ribosome maturation factor RimM [Candidatus Anaplasma sp. TIGMIC]